MSKWIGLDLRRKDNRPEEGALVALCMKPKIKSPFIHSERYDIGYLELDKDGKKLWLHHTNGVSDPVRLKQAYAIWWCYVAPFDGI